MKKHIAVLAGDGIGPEITDGAVAVLKKVAEKFGHEFTFEPLLMGCCAIEACGEPLPAHTVERCLASDSVLLGAVGGMVGDPRWDNLPGDKRPEKGLLQIRKALGLYSNIRPARLWKSLSDASPLKKPLVENGIEIIVVRELTGGIYFGERGSYHDNETGETAWDTEKYSVKEIERITEIACKLAQKRTKKVISVDKANVLESSRLWRRTVHAYAEKHYPDVTVTDMLRTPRSSTCSSRPTCSATFSPTRRRRLRAPSECSLPLRSATARAGCTNPFTALRPILRGWISQTPLRPFFPRR